MKRFLRFPTIIAKYPFIKQLIVALIFGFAGTTFGQQVSVNQTVTPDPNDCSKFDVNVEITGQGPASPVEVVLVIDRSGSMDDGPYPEPIDYAKDAAINFVQNLFDPANNPTGQNRVAVVSYATTATTDIGLTGSSGEQSVINAINGIVTNGNTNIQSGLVKADQILINNATFDCKTSRNIILLTDGVTNRDNSGNACSNNAWNTICQQNAIQAGINAQTTTNNGEQFTQNVFSIGLFNAISGNQQDIATNTIDNIQNAGLFTTESGADLSDIYDEILGNLAAAATQLGNNPFFKNILEPGFEYVSGSISESKGNASFSGNVLSWYVNQLLTETITLEYTIMADGSGDACGDQNTGVSYLKYKDPECSVVEDQLPGEDICVPCNDIDPTFSRQDCTNSFNYAANPAGASCSGSSTSYAWEFFLNGTSVGTANNESGTFVYSGGQPLTGELTAEVTATNSSGACNLPSVTETISTGLACDIEEWAFVCGDDKKVDEYGYNANCNQNTNITIPDAGNVYQYVVEIVYKGNNPGETLQFTDSNNIVHTLNRSVPVGSSSNIWVYRGLIEANTSSVNYTTSSGLACKLQSVVVYAFRNVPLASSSSGVFSSRSGYNDIQTINVTIPSFSGPRDLFIETPVSELTDDGRYLLIRAEAGGVSNEVIIYGPDSSLPGGSCCLNIPTIVLDDVPGNATDVAITVDSRNGQNGQSVNGQSWVIASGVNVDGDCFSELELSLDNKEDILCNGDNTGSITVAVDGGLAPFEYSLNGGTPQSSPVFENLTAGVYTVTVTDAIGNTDSISVTLEEPEPISIQITKENASQTGGCANGTATANPSGGVAPFTYQWSASAGDQTTQTATNLPSGTHTVVVTDANGCTSEQGVVIDCVDDCDAVISVDNVMNVLCAGELTGSATVSASSVANPTATYTFVWNTSPIQTDSGVTSSTISNVGAGVYTVSVTIDGAQCLPVEQSVTITEPNNALNVTATSTDENGPDTNDGTATANATGGTPPYTYSWSPGGEITQMITGLSDGTYTVTVTDANGCTATATTTVNPGTCQNLTASTTSTPVTCNGDSDGTASVSVSGGVGPFTYSWSPSGQTSTTITGLSAGTYTVTVTDETTQCTVTSTTTVNEPNALSSGIAVTNVKCFGDTTGSLDLTVTGGTQPYSFQWDNGETTEDLFNLVAGTYSVTITDANGCTTTDSATVQQPSEGLDLTFTKTDVLCNGESTGAIDITVTGGTQPYSYAWSNGETTEDLSDIPAGSYNITVTDANGCTISQTGINIDEPANPLSIVITKENATTAQGCTDGEATATVTGGTAPYTYQWSASAGNQTTQTATNLPSGTHTVVVTDANGCTLEQGVVIDCTNTCDAVISVDDKTDVLCTSEETGSATVSASSNANPGATFTFTWNTVPQQVDAGVTSSTISGLAAGVYTVSVTIDGTVCQPVEQSVTITEPANALNVTATATDESGPTTGDGTATATPSGGTPPYTYSWSPGGETTQTISGLSAGEYTVTVTDANGCTATATVTVNPGTCLDLAANATATPVSCFEGNDGTASVNVTGGSGDFSYSWAPNGETTTTITDLVAGVYTVTVTDNVTQCTATATATVNEPNDLTSGIAVTNVDCFGNNTGSLDLTVSGGTAPYTFEWSPGGETTEDLFNLVAGTYSVTITDANGCTTTNSATVSEPANPLALTITEQNDIVCDAIGSVTVEASGGTQPYSYNIDGGAFQSSGTFDNLEEGNYTISVLDANGCTEEITVTILKNCTVAIDDINNTFINETVPGNVLTNDFDLEGDTQTVTSTTVTTAQGVTVTIDATTGEYSYTPPVDFTGEDSFEYTVCDNGNPQACDTAIVYIEVVPQDGPENNAPIANADTNVTQVDEPVSGNVLPNDYDPDGDPIAVTGNTDPSNGSVVINPDGSYTYTPNPGFVGEDTFEYTICDNGNPALCDTTVVTIQVLDDDGNLTHAVDDAYYTTIDQEINGNVLDNDVDPENNDQTVDVAISPSNGPSNGTVTLNADGTFAYVPNPGYTGSDSFVYSIFDNGSPVATDSATVVILAGTIGNEILAIDDINDTFVNLPVSGNVSTNDINADGPAGTEIYTLVSGPTNGGTLVFNPDGTYTYTPAADYIGQDTFVYEVCDGGNPVACDTATVYIEVLPLNGPGNEAPIANADTNTTEQDTPVSGNVLPNDYDPDGDPIAVTGNTDPSNGSVTVNPDGSYTYTPNPGFVGEDTFEYTICDNGSPALCDTATVTIQVVPDAGNITVANDDSYNGLPDTDITGNVLDNDFDPEGDAQSVDVGTTPVSGPSNGTLVINPDGTFTYTPNPGFGGTDQFVYAIVDDGSPVATDTATVYITISPVGDGNDILAVDDINDTFVNLPVSGDVSTNDINTDGPAGTETFTLVSGPANGGTLVFNPDGTYTYTPPADYVGEDTFVYQVCDGGNPAACDTATVYIEIVDDPIIGNDPPIANADTNITEEGTPVSGNVLPNDFDPDNDPITVTNNTDPSNGTVTVNPDGSYTYTPNPGFTGEDTFEYTICDNGNPALCDTTIVTIQVIPDAGNITVANDDAYYGEIDQSITGNLLDNDFDPEGDAQTVNATSPLSGPSNGTVTINPDGTFEYIPNPGFTGTDQFVYEISDDGTPGASDVATVYILIEETPAPAIAIVKEGEVTYADGNCAQVGDTILYTFTVSNLGNVPLGNIQITDPLLQAPNPVVDITYVSGDTNGNDLLEGSETWIYTATYMLTQVNIDAGEVINQATVEGTDDDGTIVSDLSDESSTSENDETIVDICRNPDVEIVKTAEYNDGGDCSDPGETITYTFTVTNTGNVTLSDVVVMDTLLGGEVPGPDSGDVDGDGQLDVGEVWIYTGTYTITQEDIDAGEVNNTAMVDATCPAGSTSQDNDQVTTPLCQNPDIAIVKTGVFNDGDQDGCSDVGETIAYTFTVTNLGNVSLSDVVVDDPLLGGPIAGPDSGDADGDMELDVDETWTYTATYTVTQDDIDNGEVVNQATATADDPAGNQVSDLSDDTSELEDGETVTELCQSADIAIVKVGVFNDGDQDGCSDVGETIAYTFTVTNLGNVSLANVVVDDPLLGGPIAGPDSGDADGDTELDVDETWTYTATYAITQDDIDAGGVTNQATATANDPAGNQVSDLSDDTSELEDGETVTELCQSADIAIVKVGVFNDGDGDGCSDVGETIGYTFTVTNEGNVSLADVVVDDPLLGGPIAGPDSGDADGDTELDVDETWIYTATYTITQDDIDAGGVTNQATATANDPAGNQVSDLSDDDSELEDEETVTELCQDAAIAIVKTAELIEQGECTQVGDTIEYTFTVTNEGNVSLANIVVDDPFLGGPIAGPDSGDADGDTELDVDETWIYTATYTITQVDIDNGEVVNQATATGDDPAGNQVSDLSDDDSVTEDDATVTELCQEPIIAIVKQGIFNDEDQDKCSDVGETISYTFTVTNLGNVSLSAIEVTDVLLGGVIPGPDSGDTDGDTELDVDETWIYTADYTITQADIDAGNVTNQAMAEAVAPNGNTVSDMSDDDNPFEDDPTVTELCQDATIALVKTGELVSDSECAEVGDLIEYTFAVYNLGNVTLTDITVTDPFLTVVGGPITLAPGATDTTTFTGTYVITQDDINNGVFVNQATATGTAPSGDTVTDLSDDNSELENDPTETELCQEALIALIKTGILTDEDEDGCADVGETILYEFEVTNLGNVDLTNVIVTDDMVAVDGDPIAVLVAGSTDATTFSATYTITQEDIDNGFVENQAEVVGTTPSGDMVMDFSDDNSNFEDDPTILGLCQELKMSVTKTGVFNDENGDQIPQVGETISYAFSVTNTGTVTIYNITLEDPLPGIQVSGGPIAELEPGETDNTTFTATYAITQEDIDNGEVENQALASGTDVNGNIVEDLSDDPNNPDDVDADGDGDPDDPTITFLPNVEAPDDFEIFNGITPDGDGLNDYMRIEGIENYPNNNMKIFNRWGVLVWETDGYNNDNNAFEGESNGRATIQSGEELPTGTYFYILVRTDQDTGEVLKNNGYLYINR